MTLSPLLFVLALHADIPSTTCARSLRFMISENMTLDQHIIIQSGKQND